MPLSDRFLPAMAITLLMLDHDSLALRDPDSEYPADERSPADDRGRAQGRAVEAILTTLPTEDYTLLHLALRENFSAQELAEIVGASPQRIQDDLIRVKDSVRRRSARHNGGLVDPLRTFAALPRISPQTTLHAA